MIKKYVFTIFIVLLFTSLSSFSQTFNGTTGAIPDNICDTPANDFTVVANNVGILNESYIISITLDITHTYVGDLDIFLTNPLGTTVALTTRTEFLDIGDDFTNTVFTTNASMTLDAGVAPFTGAFLPVGNLQDFNGVNAGGTWTLKICDVYDLDIGTLNSWSLNFAPINDEPEFATPLTVGMSITENEVIGTNRGATASEVLDPTIPTPSCANYNGGDLWYTVAIPADGSTIVLETSQDINNFDTGMAVYSGVPGNLTQIICNDDSGGGIYSKITLINQPPNTVYYVRVWKWNSTSPGNFKISAYLDPSLTTFVPDDNFEQALIDLGYDSGPLNEYVLTANINTVTSLSVFNKSIADLTGIEGFTALSSFNCQLNQLTSLDVSANTGLTFLNCSNNQIINLDVSANTALVSLYCPANQLTSLGVSENIELNLLICDRNLITSLDVSENTALTKLNCGQNQLTSLDVSSNTALIDLNCGQNQLTSLDVSSNTALSFLICNNSQLEFLDVSANTALSILVCNDNQFEFLDVSNGNNTNFSFFDSSNNPALLCITVDDPAYSTSNWTARDPVSAFSIDCGTYVPDDTFENYLETHDASGVVLALGDPSSMGNGIANDNFVPTNKINTVTNLNVENLSIADLTGIEDFAALQVLNCNFNTLTTINVSENTALGTLQLYGNGLTSLDVSANTLLTFLDFGENAVDAIDLSSNTGIALLSCSANPLLSIDVSMLSDLVLFYALNTPNITTINLANGNNSAITDLLLGNSPNLFCVAVDNQTIADDWNSGINLPTNSFTKDPQTYFSIDCSLNNMPDRAYTLNVGHDFADQAQIADNTNATASEVIDPSIPAPTGCDAGGGGGTLEGGYNGSDVWYSVAIPDDGSIIIETGIDLGAVNDTAIEIYSGTPGSLTQIACNDDINFPSQVFGKLILTGRTPNEVLYIRAWTWNNNETGTFQISAYRNPAISTYVPDDAFEQALIEQAYDSGSLNDYVPTININTVTNLSVSQRNIDDLTGIEGFTVLENLSCDRNNLTNLDVSNNTALTQLNVQFNNLTNLDVSNNTTLTYLNCFYNNLTTLDVSNNIALIGLTCSNNTLNTIDLSNNIALTSLACHFNSLVSLNLANGNNTAIIDLLVNENPDLTCVTVDDQILADDWNSGTNLPLINYAKDSQTQFSANCGEVVLEAKAYLQGAFLNPRLGEEAVMRDDLRALGHLPLISPYDGTSLTNGDEFITFGADAIVDWVWVELRDDTDNSIVIDGQSALLQRDGDIVGLDGVSPLVFTQLAKHYNVVVKHRNHSGIMTSLKQPFPLNKVQNYMDGSTSVFGANALVNMNGTLAMWTGDVNDDGKINFSGADNDTNAIKDGVLANPLNAFNSVTFTATGYLSFDLDLNGEGKFSGTNNEGNVIKDNILSHPGNGFNSPTFTINSAVPEN